MAALERNVVLTFGWLCMKPAVGLGLRKTAQILD
jgi:hypothetical protein